MFDELDIPFSVDENLLSVKQLQNDKSAGPALYLNECFKYSKDVEVIHVLPLFNKIYDVGYFPTAWSEG